MASASNTAPSSPKQMSSALDPCPPSCPTVSSDSICNPAIALPSCSYAQPHLLNNYRPSKRSTPKHLSIESLNRQLDHLIQQVLVHRVRKGQPHDNLHSHRRALMKELKHTLDPRDHSFRDFSYRDQLITLLASSSKTPITEVPLDFSEWLKLLSKWIRHHAFDDILFNRDIYDILAVDGFQGYKAKELKHYLMRILGRLRYEFKIHTRGVRAMYLWIGSNPLVASLPGTASACLVFLALLELYSKLLSSWLLDDQVRYHVQQAKLAVEGFLHERSDYYRDIQNVDEALLASLAEVYSKEFTNPEHVQTVAQEMLKHIK